MLTITLYKKIFVCMLSRKVRATLLFYFNTIFTPRVKCVFIKMCSMPKNKWIACNLIAIAGCCLALDSRIRALKYFINSIKSWQIFFFSFYAAFSTKTHHIKLSAQVFWWFAHCSLLVLLLLFSLLISICICVMFYFKLFSLVVVLIKIVNIKYDATFRAMNTTH